MTDANCGAGCVAMLCGFMVPGICTVVSDELASTPKASAPIQPLMKLWFWTLSVF